MFPENGTFQNRARDFDGRGKLRVLQMAAFAVSLILFSPRTFVYESKLVNGLSEKMVGELKIREKVAETKDSLPLWFFQVMTVMQR